MGFVRRESLELEKGIEGNKPHFCLLRKLERKKTLNCIEILFAWIGDGDAIPA